MVAVFPLAVRGAGSNKKKKAVPNSVSFFLSWCYLHSAAKVHVSLSLGSGLATEGKALICTGAVQGSGMLITRWGDNLATKC